MKSIIKLQDEALRELGETRRKVKMFVCLISEWLSTMMLADAKLAGIEEEIREFGKRCLGIDVPPNSGDAS